MRFQFLSLGGFLRALGKTCERTIFKRQVCVLEIDSSISTPATDTYLRYRGYCILESTDIKSDFINVPQPRFPHISGSFNTLIKRTGGWGGGEIRWERSEHSPLPSARHSFVVWSYSSQDFSANEGGVHLHTHPAHTRTAHTRPSVPPRSGAELSGPGRPCEPAQRWHRPPRGRRCRSLTAHLSPPLTRQHNAAAARRAETTPNPQQQRVISIAYHQNPAAGLGELARQVANRRGLCKSQPSVARAELLPVVQSENAQ